MYVDPKIWKHITPPCSVNCFPWMPARPVENEFCGPASDPETWNPPIAHPWITRSACGAGSAVHHASKRSHWSSSIQPHWRDSKACRAASVVEVRGRSVYSSGRNEVCVFGIVHDSVSRVLAITIAIAGIQWCGRRRGSGNPRTRFSSFDLYMWMHSQMNAFRSWEPRSCDAL